MNIHGSIYTYNKTIYVNAHHPITVTCNIHGDFTVVPNKHISAKQGCPVCSDQELKSKPVIEIQNFLKTCDIMFEMEKKFDSCKNINHLPFDFYIPELNLLIEYDGIQHFKPIEYFGGEEGLAEQQRNDEIKNKYCYDNNITLLRIKYSDDHIKIIKDFISKNINY
ncbi:Uncharacterised protein [Escherichia coli]|uniref:hypothetical protein n=1 Tax=Escherichia coli TaxID=562 RepID=UPI001A53A3AB|nr:hypothetical protein [Escherichia coli]VVZ37624.1 Uncharacterised protein [Escherichia coli]HBB9485894.1 hypothetical protein [Escherichia coli]